MNFNAPDINYAGISPIIALTGGLVLTLLAGLIGGSRRRQVIVVSIVGLGTLAAAAGLLIAQWGAEKNLVAGALRLDDLAIAASLLVIAAAAFCIPLSWREESVDRPLGPAGHAEFQALLICSVLGMTLIAQAQNLISFFVALELLSIPLYVLCGSALRREASLESGLKYLIIGSLGSATLLYGLAFIYGASESTDFAGIRTAVGGSVTDDPLLLIGIALAATGLAFKLSIAPFHQWTPDVYEGAPTPVTAFMAVATKAAVFCVLVRFFDVALGPAVDDWQPALAALATVSIVVGNAGALGQRSLKRLLGYSGVAQAGYMMVGVVAASAAGAGALVFYLAAYTLMNLGAFAVITIRERESRLRRRHPRGRGARARAARARRGAHGGDAGARRAARHRGVHRQALPDRGDGGRRLHLARGDDRDRDDDLARLLPAGDRRGLDAPLRRGRAGVGPGDGRRLAGGRHRDHRRALQGDPRAADPGHRGDDLLRHHPLAAGRLGDRRGRLDRRADRLSDARRAPPSSPGDRATQSRRPDPERSSAQK